MNNHRFGWIAGTLISCFVFFCKPGYSQRRHGSPIHALYETAGTLGRRTVEISGSYTNTRTAGQNRSGQQFGQGNLYEGGVALRLGYGLSPKTDIKIRFAYLHLPDENYLPDPSFNTERKRNYFFSLIPKVALVKDKLALLLPLNFYDFESSQPALSSYTFREKYVSFAPHLIRTFLLKRNKIDLSASVNTELALNKDDYGVTLFAVHTGFNINSGFSSDLSRWAIRPELGYQFQLWNGTGFWNVGIGLQVVIPSKRK
jgi:hypothetical protein